MADFITIRGAEQFGVLARVLRQTGAKDLRRELNAGITQATKPLRADARESARSILPSRGGLGARVARTSMPIRRRTAGATAGIRIEARPGAVADPQRIDRGRVRHPVYGHGPWVLQDVPAGWFTKPMEAGAPVVRRELVDAMNRIIARIAGAV